MNALNPPSIPRTLPRASTEAIARFASTEAQAARLAGLGHYPPARSGAPVRLWDRALIDRLSAPLTRVRE